MSEAEPETMSCFFCRASLGAAERCPRCGMAQPDGMVHTRQVGGRIWSGLVVFVLLCGGAYLPWGTPEQQVVARYALGAYVVVAVIGLGLLLLWPLPPPSALVAGWRTGHRQQPFGQGSMGGVS